jgi:thiol-disulfide isomerase/thioredoxin
MTRSSLSLVRRIIITAVAFAIIAPAMLTQRPLVAQEEGADEAAAANEELFTVPDDDAKALHDYIQKVAKTPPPEDASPEEQTEFATKALNALVTAADRLLKVKPTDKQAIDAHGFRIQALQALVAMGDEDAGAKLDKALQAARNDSRQQVVGMGWQTYIQRQVEQWPQLDDAAKQAFQQEIVKKINADGVQPMDVSIVQITALQLDGTDNEFVVKLLEEAVPLLQKAAADEVAQPEQAKPEGRESIAEALAEANFDGMVRRLNLPGNEMEISGELLSGGEVDWNSYRGKVVLVDFWATWCGPCRAEIPNVLAMYDAYHEKGFDVLGVSLDDTPEAAQKYAKQNKLPWDSLFPKSEEERSWNHPLVKHYGIGGIPTAILVGKDGKVVNMNARDEVLRNELKRLLGEPIEKPTAEKADAEAAAANAEAS